MPENFSFEHHDLIYVNGVRNFLVQAKNKKERKNFPLIFHILYALICGLCIYLAADGMALGMGGLLCVLCLCLAPAMCVYNFLYSPIPIKFLAILVPIVAFGAKSLIFSSPLTFENVAVSAFMYILCILVGAALTKVSVSGYTKSTCFIFVTVIYAVITLCICAFLLICAKGTCSPTAAVQVLDGFFENTISSAMDFAKSEEGLLQLQLMTQSSDITTEQLLTELEKSLTLSVATAKATLPAAFILSCMFFAFLTIEIFSLFAKKLNIDVFVCIMDNFWTYRLSRATTMMYDIVFFAYILGMFIPFSPVISAAVSNLLLIMTPVVFIPGFKSIHGFFTRKKFTATASTIVTLIIVFAATMLTGMLGVYIISSIGVTFVFTREIQESIIFPAKFASDCEEYRKLYKEEAPDNPFDKK